MDKFGFYVVFIRLGWGREGKEGNLGYELDILWIVGLT